jgi:hypothetical protein
MRILLRNLNAKTRTDDSFKLVLRMGVYMKQVILEE